MTWSTAVIYHQNQLKLVPKGYLGPKLKYYIRNNVLNVKVISLKSV